MITFHFHTCDSATTATLTSESILEESFIGVFWSKLNKKKYKIEVIGYPGLYCSLQGNSGNALIDIDGRYVEKSKAQVIKYFGEAEASFTLDPSHNYFNNNGAKVGDMKFYFGL